MTYDTPSDWVSIAEATGIIGKSERTLRRWVAEKQIPSKREGRRVLVDVSGYREPSGGIIEGSDLQAKMAVLQAENDMLRATVERLDRQLEVVNVALTAALQIQQKAIQPPDTRRFRWPWQRE